MLDPDEEDGGLRHEDRDAQRWPLIASVVAKVGDALADSAWLADSEFEGYGMVRIPEYPGELTKSEQDIVTSWFRESEAVRFDPWSGSIVNGRHRLWATLSHFGHSSVPIVGDALVYAEPASIEVLGEDWNELFSTNVEQLGFLEWFDKSDSLNWSFSQSLISAASGEIPSPIELPPMERSSLARGKSSWWRFWARRD